MNKTKTQAFKDFLDFKKTEVSTKSKLEGYELYVRKFLDSTRKPLKEFSETEIINFINSISKKYSVGTMNCIKSMINSFCFWNFREDYFKRFPHIRRICSAQLTERKYQPEDMLKKEDIQKMVQEEPSAYWKAYLLIFFYGGFRPGEVCNIKWRDIMFVSEGAYIKVFVKKNHKTFEKFIPEDASFYLKKLQQNNSRYVFPTKRTNKHGIPVGDLPMTRSGVYQHLLPLARKALNKHVNPYVLRHSIATILYRRDDLKDDDVAQQMGHSRAMRNTYNHPTIEEQRARMKKLWIKPEDLPPKKKLEYEKRIQALEDQFLRFAKGELIYDLESDEIMDVKDMKRKKRISRKE